MNLRPGFEFANRYKLIQHIGTGGFSVVWKVFDKYTDNLEVALKIFAYEKGMDDVGIRQFQKEYSLMANLNHQGLLRASHLDFFEGSPYLVMPYCSKGSLASKLIEKGTFTEREIATVLLQLSGALKYLHEEKILHQDIKPDNVLIDSKGNYLLTDFGISSRLRSTLRKSTTSNKALTLAYAPPERFAGKMQSVPESDVFSVGVLLFELASGDVPWMGAGGTVLKEDTGSIEISNEFSKQLEKWINLCVQYNPDQRPSAKQLEQVASTYIQEGYWPDVPKKKEKNGESKSAKRVTQVIENARKAGQSGGSKTRQKSQPYPHTQKDYSSGQEKQSGSSVKRFAYIAILILVVGGGITYYAFTGDEGGNLESEVIGLPDTEYLQQIARAEAFEEAEDWQKALEAYRRAWAMPGQSQDMAKETYLEGLLSDQSEKETAATREATDRQASETAGLKAEADEAHAASDQARREAIAARQHEEKALQRKEAIKSISDNMVYVSGGTFTMGCTSEQSLCMYTEEPAHQVTLSSFYISKYEVSQVQWEVIMGTTIFELFDEMSLSGSVGGSGANYPICYVTWEETHEFISRLNRLTGKNYRLPTEAEWEYAARGGSKSEGYKYSGSNNLNEVAWSRDSSPNIEFHQVGQKSPNELGLFDMSGNVEELCQDRWAKDYYSNSPSTNPKGPTVGDSYVTRGGAYVGDCKVYCQVAFRTSTTRSGRGNSIGFRLALNQ
ncbi:MAG: SUMF1/EgtB/PvdO family nonheme iron enzyme [Cyclobacteriaceae bacterium]|nr:SUMF1/EgtB/PvdO family nonheme iron enzyme [Cyclobacteriaceae bacterium]